MPAGDRPPHPPLIVLKPTGPSADGFRTADDVRQTPHMQALIGWFMLATWIAIVWICVKLVQDVRGAVQDRRRPRRQALR